MLEGILEYYAVASDGKLHESLLEIAGEPSHLHLALILAGFEASEYGPYDRENFSRPLLKISQSPSGVCLRGSRAFVR